MEVKAIFERPLHHVLIDCRYERLDGGGLMLTISGSLSRLPAIGVYVGSDVAALRY
jgi:hypothetical protein